MLQMLPSYISSSLVCFSITNTELVLFFQLERKRTNVMTSLPALPVVLLVLQNTVPVPPIWTEYYVFPCASSHPWQLFPDALKSKEVRS